MEKPPGQRRLRIPRRSIFWKVAGTLVGVQVATSILAVVLSARFAEDRSLELVAGSLLLRLDALAEEVEQRGAPLYGGLGSLPRPLLRDLGARVADPVILLDPFGRPIRYIPPGAATPGEPPSIPHGLTLPSDLPVQLAAGGIVVQVKAPKGQSTYGLAPVYDPDGFLMGGLLVTPLSRSIDRELAGTRGAYRRAIRVVTLISFLVALTLGALFTWALVRPIRRITQQVERIGAGDYTARVGVHAEDELGRLAASVNQMAAEVERSITALQETDALRRELIANVGHDIRTPLAAMIGYVEESVHRLQNGNAGEAVESLQTAQRQGVFLTRLVGDLFELSLLDSAAPPLRLEPVPVAELVSHAAETHRSEFKRAGIAFDLAMPPGLPVIEADGVRLLRALDNLLSNARQHTPSGGSVRLLAERAGDVVRVSVQDTGAGIAQEDLDRVFERYYRGKDARTRRTEGTGLGLSISRAVARAHGGDLTASSVVGQGSTFTLSLPVAEPEAARKQEGLPE